MKTIIYTLILSLSFCLIPKESYSQTDFSGTWEWQNGSEIFRVKLWPKLGDTSILEGHYEMVQVNSDGSESHIYSSNKEEFEGNNDAWLPHVIYLRGDNQNLAGNVHDNTVDKSLYHQFKVGRLTLELLPPSSGNITAHWTVRRQEGLIVNEAPDYSIPTDIVLTKVN